MDVFNKIYSQVSSSVSSTVSQLSSVLPGNPVTREFDATTHIASGGPGLLWRIYRGVKRSTRQDASIFVFEKRQLDKWNKTDRELVLESLRRGVAQLTKIRHPQVLIVQHPLEESRESLAFATEPVFSSLANVLGQTYNMPQPTNLSDYKLYDIEIKYGLSQLGEGLAFLHNDVKLLHRNICPESVIINAQGAWKIFGFDFCVASTSPPNRPPEFPFVGYGPTVPNVTQPELAYAAPEYALGDSYGTASDIFSLGMLIYRLHTKASEDAFVAVKNLQRFKARADELKRGVSAAKLRDVPEDLRGHVAKMLTFAPDSRPDAHQFVKVSYFEDVGVKTLNYLDSLLQWDNLQRSQFFKGLPESLKKLPHRVRVQRVLPCLVRDLAQPAMVPFVLPSIFDIAHECTQQEYIENVLPHLKPVMMLTEPIQILLIMLQKMELLLKLTPATEIQQHVLPMLYRGLDSTAPQVHELCLSVLPTFAGLLDHSNVKNSLLPRIKKLCLSTSTLSVRVNCLLCIGRLLEHLDKWLVLDEVLPFLPQIPSREPAVLMGILGIYKLAMNHKKLGISKEVIATRILPFLIPLCIENGLNLQQFNALVALVKQMFQLVENEHRTKLEQLNSVQEQQRAMEAAMPTFSSTTQLTNPNRASELDQVFTGLGLETYSSTTNSPTSNVGVQEDVKAFHNRAPLEPISSPETKTTQPKQQRPPVKDLSDSLLERNLNSLRGSFPAPISFNSQQFGNFNQAAAHVAGQSGTNQFASGNAFAGGFGNPSINSPIGHFNSPAGNNFNQVNRSGLNNFPSQWGNNNNNNYYNNERSNWGALDSLLPSQTSKIPMNRLGGAAGQMPGDQSNSLLLPSNANDGFNNRNDNKSAGGRLSNDDIMDLLS